MSQRITITKPVVILPLDEYERLLEEAGEKPTPKLKKEIMRAKREFRKRKTIDWKQIKKRLGMQD